MVNYRAPRTRYLVHMETHNKLIASVWIQILNHHTLCDTVDKQNSDIMAICLTRIQL